MAFRLPGDEPRDKVTEKVWGLCYSASRGDVHKLRSYMHQEGIMLNVNDRIGAAALMLATQQGHAKALTSLIAVGADVNMSQSERKILMPLMTAAERGDVDCLIALIEGGAKVNAVRYDGQTSLAIAIQEGCSDDVKDVIDAKTQVRTRPFMGSLVMTANRSWKEQHEECAMLLLQAGADVGYTNDSGYSLLMSSAANGSIKIVKSLIQAGANINQVANDGATALLLACRCTSLLDYRLYRECVSVLLQAGAAVDAANLDGKTALILAVQNTSQYKKKFQRADIIQLLLQAGANTNIQDKTGKTALMYAAEKNLTSFCKMLMNHSADVSIQDSSDKTAYMYVTDGRCLEVLLTPTVSVANCKLNDGDSQDKRQSCHLAVYLNMQDKEGKTALMHAAMGPLTSFCRLLIERYYSSLDSKRQIAGMYASKSDCMLDGRAIGSLLHGHTVPNPNIQDHTGKTALMHAARHNLTHCCRLLLERYADPNIQDNRGKTALMHARGEDTLRVLLSGGADSEIVDSSNCTVLVHLLKREMPISEVINTVTVILEHGANLVVDPSYHHRLLFGYHSSSSDSLVESLVREGRRQIIRLLVCNGFVTRAAPTRYFPESYTSPLCRALNDGRIDIVKYCIACCYLRESDLRDFRAVISTAAPIHGPGIPSHVDISDEIRLFAQQAVSQPWPLVKLAFIAVSSALGASPERSQKIGHTQLPARLQRMLMFQEPISRLPVNEWANIPLCFDPSDYERMPRPRPLLYYWPFGRDMVI